MTTSFKCNGICHNLLTFQVLFSRWDSLVLKIEGLVRDICGFSGVTTFYQAKDKQGRIVVREKDINWLLREEPIKSLFDEDDLLFVKFILIEKAGLNLRHKIAHCLIYHPEYNISCIHLLLLVLFKLGRYDFVKSGDTVEEGIEELNRKAMISTRVQQAMTGSSEVQNLRFAFPPQEHKSFAANPN